MSLMLGCFSITMNCAHIHQYSQAEDSLDENTDMWVIEGHGWPWTAVIHLDTIVLLAHLLPIYKVNHAPRV